MPALEVADIFRRHGEAYRKAHAGHLGRVERRIMGAIEACRTARARRPCRALHGVRPRPHRLQFVPYGQIR